MSHFYAQLEGSGKMISRCGTTSSGIWAHIRGWDFGVQIDLSYDVDKGCDSVDLTRTGGSRGNKPSSHIATLYENEQPPEPEKTYCARCAGTVDTSIIVPKRAVVRRVE